jgi:hypothetical protein
MDADTHVLVCLRVSEHASVLACVYFRITLAKLGIAANGVATQAVQAGYYLRVLWRYARVLTRCKRQLMTGSRVACMLAFAADEGPRAL